MNDVFELQDGTKLAKAVQCDDFNWSRRGGCNAKTKLKCNRCNRATCGTHKHWHAHTISYDATTNGNPERKTVTRTVCGNGYGPFVRRES